MEGKSTRKANLDDGFSPEIVDGATFDGVFEIPHIFPPEHIIRPKGLTPFSQRHRAPTDSEGLEFFEKDPKFACVLIDPKAFVGEFARFPVLISPDCSAYRDAPLLVQIAGIYRSRALGSYYQRNGCNVFPLVRWGDERTYTTSILPEKVAFTGVEKRSPVAISTYGCIKTAEDKRYFRDGLVAMLEELEPSLVLVHGAMPERVFRGLLDATEFVHYQDWTSRMKGGEANG